MNILGTSTNSFWLNLRNGLELVVRKGKTLDIGNHYEYFRNIYKFFLALNLGVDGLCGLYNVL